MSGQGHGAAATAIVEVTCALRLEYPEVTRMDGGVANRSYRLREGPRDFVLRVPAGQAPSLGANWPSEIAMQALASRAGLSPPIVLVGPEGRYVVSEFAAGCAPTFQAMQEHPTLWRVGEWFARLHSLEPPPGLAIIDFGERAAAYLERIAGKDPRGRIGHLRRELARRRAAVAPLARFSPCHHDPHRRNFLDDGTRLLAIDWEYAGPGDPAADLAACIGYHALDASAVEALLEGYGGAGVRLRARVTALSWIFDCLWFGWNAVADESGLTPDPAEQARIAARLGA